MYRLLRAIGSILSRYLNRQTFGAYPHSPADLALMRQILQPADVVLVEGNRRISTAIKYLTQSSWSHAAIYVGDRGGVDAEGRTHAFVEADMEHGVHAFPIEEFEGLHLRVCRPVGLLSQDARRIVDHVLGRLGDRYDLKNVFDLARYLLPTPPVPTRWRRRMLALGSSDPTRAICSTLIVEAFETVGFPVLPIVTSKASALPTCRDRAREVQHIRHHRLFVPRDFDVSPYFRIIKPSLVWDYRSLTWVDADQLDAQLEDGRRLNIPALTPERISA
jgi:Permuted papain-like amidase enzyme, YaeF/YiiX, C92 family